MDQPTRGGLAQLIADHPWWIVRLTRSGQVQ